MLRNCRGGRRNRNSPFRSPSLPLLGEVLRTQRGPMREGHDDLDGLRGGLHLLVPRRGRPRSREARASHVGGRTFYDESAGTRTVLRPAPGARQREQRAPVAVQSGQSAPRSRTRERVHPRSRFPDPTPSSQGTAQPLPVVSESCNQHARGNCDGAAVLTCMYATKKYATRHVHRIRNRLCGCIRTAATPSPTHASHCALIAPPRLVPGSK